MTVLPPERVPDPQQPFAIIDRAARGLKLTCVNQAASQAGLYPGLSLVHARSLCARIETAQQDDNADMVYLQHLARNAGRFTPLVAYSLPYGLMLDVTGCDHLFDGPAAMLQKVTCHYRQLGVETLAALAPTPAAARAFARFGVNRFVQREELACTLDMLKLPALEAPSATQTGLRRAGFQTLHDIKHISPKALAARFGEVLPARLDALYGKSRQPISPISPPPALYLPLRLSEPLSDQAMVENQLVVLAKDFFQRLEKLGLGSLALAIGFFRVDGHIENLMIETGRPLIDPAIFHRLMKERLSTLATPLDAGYGFDTLTLSATRCAPLQVVQTGLIEEGADTAEIAQLVDRLSTRLGASHIVVAQTIESHMPERAAFWGVAQHRHPQTAALAARLAAQGLVPLAPNPPERPLRLFCPPQPVDVIAALPDAPPASFRWRHVTHKIRLAEGPERVSAEWWRSTQKDRDYYRVEDENGQRFWIFRHGPYPKTKWFLHGLFA